jgi:peptidoglycan/xylan/chitin deacetylase (PgdA/CDA1 family)
MKGPWRTMPEKEIPILMYHSLDPSRFLNKTALYAELFKRQMSCLKKNTFEVLPLASCAQEKGRQDFFQKKAVLTFDDGYIDNYLLAFPILRDFGFPCTFFVTVEDIGREGFLNWSMIEEMSETPGIEIGSHGLSHEPLADVSPERARRSIGESKKILEDRLGKPVNAFSYPSGSFNEYVVGCVEEAGYRYACAATHVHDKRWLHHPLTLRRIKISESSRWNLLFLFRLSGFYNSFRRV